LFARHSPSMEIRRYRLLQWMARLLRFLAYCIDGQHPVQLEQDDHEALQEDLNTLARPLRPLPIEEPVVTAGILPPPPGLPDFPPIRPDAIALVPQSDLSGVRGTWPSFPDPPPTSNVWVRRPDMLNRTGNFHLFRNCPALLGMPAILTTLQKQYVHHQTICQQCVIQTYVQRGLPGC
jgi:hypothetical protein